MREAREDAADVLDGLRVLVRAVARGHDALELSALQVRAPIRHDAVAGIGGIAASASTCTVFSVSCALPSYVRRFECADASVVPTGIGGSIWKGALRRLAGTGLHFS